MQSERLSAAERKEELKQVRKVYFLIHPAYFQLREPFLVDDIPDEMVKLFQGYIDVARNLQPDELMVVVTALSSGDIQRAMQRSADEWYYKKMKEVEKEANNRDQLVFLTDSAFANGKNTFDRIKEIALNRGYAIDASILSESFGETLDKCVLEYTERLRSDGRLQQPTIIELSRSGVLPNAALSIYAANLENRQDALSRSGIEIKWPTF